MVKWDDRYKLLAKPQAQSKCSIKVNHSLYDYSINKHGQNVQVHLDWGPKKKDDCMHDEDSMTGAGAQSRI